MYRTVRRNWKHTHTECMRTVENIVIIHHENVPNWKKNTFGKYMCSVSENAFTLTSI